MAPRIGLVLTAGGARGAYQAGALRAVAELVDDRATPFQVVAGVSSGAINGAFVTCLAHDFHEATERLARLWAGLRVNDIFYTDGISLTKVGLHWLTDLSLGGWIGTGRGKSLLNTAPLHALLTASLDLASLQANLRSGLVHGFAVTATNYTTGAAVTFFDGAPTIAPWFRSTRVSRRETLTAEHVLASAAIPVFFPAVSLDDAYYGDGCVRLLTPLSPAIHLGSDRVLAIGVRYQPPRAAPASGVEPARYPMLADLGGVLLNAMFLDALEADVERMQRINQTLELVPRERRGDHPQRLRVIPVMTLRPSEDLGALGVTVLARMPYTVRHFLRGLGASPTSGWDLLSYLAFDSAYTERLLDLGYRDTMAARDAVLRFIHPDR